METTLSSTHANEIKRHARFEFGKNWNRFLKGLNAEQVATAERSLQKMLNTASLEGKTFLDIGSGSGLFSLAARRLGATVHSFDFDPESVACTKELRRRYFPVNDGWTIDEASALDAGYLKNLGQFDIVYSWGVLHHTGKMWSALENVHPLVSQRGKLFLALYNDQGSRSRRWLLAKRIYNQLPRFMKSFWAVIAIAPTELKASLSAILNRKFADYLRGWRHEPTRGMSRWRDIIDWVGGYPYEYASPDEIFDFYYARGFDLSRLVCKGAGFGCAEYIFIRRSALDD